MKCWKLMPVQTQEFMAISAIRLMLDEEAHRVLNKNDKDAKNRTLPVRLSHQERDNETSKSAERGVPQMKIIKIFLSAMALQFH